MKAYLQFKNARSDGNSDCLMTQKVECKENPLWWQEKGLSYTASGYGRRIPTRYMVKYNNRWRRVYAICFSNSSTFYIDSGDKKEKVVVNIDDQ